MQRWALETHIRISRNMKKVVDLMRNNASVPQISHCYLRAHASGSRISGNLIVGCNGSARHLHDTVIDLHD